MSSMSLADLAARFYELKESKRTHEQAIDEIQEQIDCVKTQISDELMQEGMQSVKISGIGTVYMEVSQFPKIEDKEKFFSYLEETQQEDMIKVSVDHNTLRGWWKTQLVELEPESIGLSIFKKTDVKIRKG